MAPCTFWLLGAAEDAEFAACVTALEPTCALRKFAAWPVMRDLLAAGEWPSAVLICQLRPGDSAQADVAAMREVAPNLPVIALCGSWCEGELRSGRPWPASFRVYAHQAPLRLAREAAQLAKSELALCGLPLTTTEDERALERARREHGRPRDPRGGRAAISASHRATAEFLADACRAQGIEPVAWSADQTRHAEPCQFALWDAPRSLADDLPTLKAFVRAVAPAKVSALAGFPRVDEVLQAQEAGVSLVLSKPLWLEDLWQAFDEAG